MQDPCKCPGPEMYGRHFVTSLCSVNFATLKSLRLASRTYAYLPKLLAEVFQCIRIEATPEQVDVAEWLDLSLIQPYVRAVVMVPSKYSWAMPENTFQHIIWGPRIEEIYDREYELRRAHGDYINRSVFGNTIKELGIASFIDRHADGRMPFSHDDVARSYDSYLQHARLAYKMFETRRIHRAWTRVLVQLPNIDCFTIGSWQFDGNLGEDQKEPQCEVRTHRHDYSIPGHEYSVCRQLHEPVGEALFRAAIASIIAAQSTVSHLEIECVLDHRFAWAEDGTIDELDLSQLRSLSFDPVGPHRWETGQWTEENRSSAIAQGGFAIATLLHKCSASLVELSFVPEHDSDYLIWPPSSPNEPPVLPVLESFTTGASLNLSACVQFISRSTALSHLQLIRCGGGTYPWREVWDAIRDHPNRMMLDFDTLPCNDWAECSVLHHTGEASKADYDNEPSQNIQYSLENYLSGRRHWDRTLSMWFEDDDGSEDSSGTD